MGERMFIVRGEVDMEWFYVTLGMGGSSILAGIVDLITENDLVFFSLITVRTQLLKGHTTDRWI